MSDYITTSTGAKIVLTKVERDKFRGRIFERLYDAVHRVGQTVTKRYILDNQHYTLEP